MWEESQRYPDPRVRALDPRFAKHRLPLASVERLFTGLRWAEGPVWFGDLRCLLVSDIPNNRVLRWEEETGAVSVFRKPSNNANGHTRDFRGRLISCEHLTRRVTRTEPDGAITVLAERFDGRRLNSPNDVVAHPDGSVWFTDPAFGIGGFYEGERAEQELPMAVYRWDPSGRLDKMTDEVEAPNGLAFSPDRRTLYVVASRADPRKIVAFEVRGERLGLGRDLVSAGPGTPDGLRVDVDGNLWCGWGMGEEDRDGVMVFSPEGEPLGHIALPERCANLCFGGRHRNRLFMAASHSVYSLHVNTQGLPGG
jgi:gluconolactonase